MKFLVNWAFRTIFLGTLMVMIAGSLYPTQSQSSTPNFDRLKAAFEQNDVFAASFSHQYKDSFTGEEQYTEGQIWIGKNRYKIEGDQQMVVVEDSVSTVYDGSKNRVITSDYVEAEDDFAPSRMLQGVDDSFSVTEENIENGETKIILTSDDPFSIFVEVEIFLDSNGNPLRIEAIDQAENELITQFNNGGFVEENLDLFELIIPEDAEQIDLREQSS